MASPTTYNVRKQLESQIEGYKKEIENLKAGKCFKRFSGHDMICGEGPDFYKKYCSEACRLRAENEVLKAEIEQLKLHKD